METEKPTKLKLIKYGSVAKFILITCQFYRFKKLSVAFFLVIFQPKTLRKQLSTPQGFSLVFPHDELVSDMR